MKARRAIFAARDCTRRCPLNKRCCQDYSPRVVCQEPVSLCAIFCSDKTPSDKMSVFRVKRAANQTHTCSLLSRAKGPECRKMIHICGKVHVFLKPSNPLKNKWI